MEAAVEPVRQPDKRMQKTKGAIRSALLGLLSQKDASRINVSELTEAAEISRKTFYLHYSSVEEAVTELENEIEQKVITALRQSNFWENRHDLYTVFSQVDKVLREDADCARYLHSRYARFVMMYKLKAAIKRTVLEQTRGKVEADESDLDAVTDFAVSGIVSMYYEWLKAQKLTLRQLAEKANRILSYSLMSLTGKKTEEKEQSKEDGET